VSGLDVRPVHRAADPPDDRHTAALVAGVVSGDSPGTVVVEAVNSRQNPHGLPASRMKNPVRRGAGLPRTANVRPLVSRIARAPHTAGAAARRMLSGGAAAVACPRCDSTVPVERLGPASWLCPCCARTFTTTEARRV
jgi:ribosomal protein L37AE/L43A